MAVSTRSQGGKLYIPAPDRKRTRRRTCPAPAPTPAPALLQAAPPAAPPAQSPARSPKPRKNYVDKGVTADLSPRKAKSPKTKTPPPPGGISKNYADKGVTADLSPRKTKNPKAETPPPAGGISKIGAGSKQKTPPPSPVDPLLVKRRGRLVNNNLQVIPAHVLDGRPVKRFPQVQFPVTKGLWNKGELCYRNATLQALFHTPAFYRYLGKMHKDCRDGPTTKCVVCTLQWLAQAYYNDQVSIRPYGNSTTRVAGPLDPLRLFNQTCKRNPPTDEVTLGDMIEEFAAESQSDAWNFIQYLMGLIRDKELPTDDATFSHMFDMPSEQSWTCQQCGETFTREVREEEALEGGSVGISVSVQHDDESTTLAEFLGHHFNTGFYRRCQGDQCKHLDTEDWDGPLRKVTRRITQTPEVLLIQLQMFIHNKLGTVPIKLDEDVEFDEYLNLGPFTKDGEDVLYRLDGVVAHRGTEVIYGHYISAVRQTDSVKIVAADDDTFVGETNSGRDTFREMLFPNSHDNFANPYVLIYSKV